MELCTKKNLKGKKIKNIFLGRKQKKYIQIIFVTIYRSQIFFFFNICVCLYVCLHVHVHVNSCEWRLEDNSGRPSLTSALSDVRSLLVPCCCFCQAKWPVSFSRLNCRPVHCRSSGITGTHYYVLFSVCSKTNPWVWCLTSNKQTSKITPKQQILK